MSSNPPTPEQRYQVVANDEAQYSIWPEGRELPPGWHSVGACGTQSECLSHIEHAWTDMRPRSLREQMARAEPRAATPPAAQAQPRASLVSKLAQGRHPIAVTGPASQSAEAFQAGLARGLIRVRFTATEGGTELALRFDPAGLAQPGTGAVRLVSALKLDGQALRCVADIDPASRQGQGHFEILAAG